ncbi:DUF63 family protein [Methanocaldococcus indicus]|uniref:DUF63 family protein n=1 Tax=Methanocaldococcus indicus TaxID=213231 RepID=UPI003C6DA31D
MIDYIKEFIYKYYILPAETGSGYNLVQEITYGAILAFALYLFYLGLKKLDVKIDFKFAIPSVVFAVLIALMRALVDLGYIERSFLTITPGIIFLVGGFFIITILLSAYFFKDNYYKVSAVIGAIPLLYFLTVFFKHIHHPEAFIYFILLFSPVLIVVYLINKKINILKDRLDYLAVIGQLTDATATTVGIAFFHYWEQHPIPRFLMEHFTPYSFLIIKTTVVLVILYILNKDVDNEDLRNIIKLCIMALGLAPGLRDLFRTIMGT